ncbi:MAG: alpha/beta hydrolase [Lachnospiraceae bacterium]|nr:alpha/beta hydrolase [Lachnospiraceae bacterium]
MKKIDYILQSVVNGRLTGFIHENDNGEMHPAIIICPGGGYKYLTPHEGEPVAAAFFAKGYNAFVCYYPICQDAVYPAPQLAIFEALAYVRDNAGKFHVIENNIAVAGFSAGGHVAASAGVLYKDREIQAGLGVNGTHIRPDAMVLIYPCIGVDIEGYGGGISKNNVLRCDELVDGATPPAFLVTSFGDTFVCCNQSLNMARALSDNNVPFELHCFEPGDHGFLNNNNRTLGESTTRYIGFDSWFSLCTDWLRDRWNPNVGFGKNVSADGRIIEDYFELSLMG